MANEYDKKVVEFIRHCIDGDLSKVEISINDMIFSKEEGSEAFGGLLASAENQLHIVERLVEFCETNSSSKIDNNKMLFKLFTLKDVNGRSMLWNSCFFGHISMTKYLLSKMNDEELIDQKSKVDATPLMVASFNGFESIVRLLLNKSIISSTINDKDETGRSALFIAVENGHFGVVEMLIHSTSDTNKIDVNTCTNEGISALFIAIEKNYYNIIVLLIQNGANPALSVPSNGFTPLMIATELNRISVIELLISVLTKEEINVKNNEGFSALAISAIKPNTFTPFKLLVFADANLIDISASKQSPILVCLLHKNQTAWNWLQKNYEQILSSQQFSELIDKYQDIITAADVKNLSEEK